MPAGTIARRLLLAAAGADLADLADRHVVAAPAPEGLRQGEDFVGRGDDRVAHPVLHADFDAGRCAFGRAELETLDFRLAVEALAMGGLQAGRNRQHGQGRAEREGHSDADFLVHSVNLL